jgi:hypothetical protein
MKLCPCRATALQMCSVPTRQVLALQSAQCRHGRCTPHTRGAQRDATQAAGLAKPCEWNHPCRVVGLSSRSRMSDTNPGLRPLGFFPAANAGGRKGAQLEQGAVFTSPLCLWLCPAKATMCGSTSRLSVLKLSGQRVPSSLP